MNRCDGTQCRSDRFPGRRRTEVKDAPSVTFRVDVCTAEHRTERECRPLDLHPADAIQQVWSHKLPSHTCYIESIHIQDSVNTLPVDVRRLQQDSKFAATMRSRIAEEASPTHQPVCLSPIRTQMHSDTGREVYRAVTLLPNPSSNILMTPKRH